MVEWPFLCGSFTWTGFDYEGEPNPYGWPDISNNTGLMDVCGFPKDKYYYFESCWSDRPMVHLLPQDWNPPGKEGKTIRLMAFSNGEQVELFLNGRSLGRLPVVRDAPVEWQVPYSPGRLEARAYRGGRTVATDRAETTGAPARLALAPARALLRASGEDAVVVAASALDAGGRVVPSAHDLVSFELTGEGRILGVGNGNPGDHSPDKASQRPAFHGLCMAVVEAGSPPGSLRLQASAPGLKAAAVTLRAR